MRQEILYLDVLAINASQRQKLAGMRRFAAARGWEVQMVERPDASPEKLPAILSRRRPVGCIVEGSGHKVDLPPRLFGRIPIVYLEYPAKVVGNAPNVLVDDDAIARQAIRELTVAKPSCFAVVGHPRPWMWSRHRVRAFRAAVAAEMGAKCRLFPSVPIDQWEREEDFVERLVPWIQRLPRQCAVFTVSDETALLFLRAVHASGRTIPKDLTLCSTDNLQEICEATHPTISSIHLDFERMGFIAARALGERISGRAHRGDAKSAGPSLAAGEGLVVGPLMTVRRKSTSGRGRQEKFILDAVETIRREACNGLSAAELIKRQSVSKRLFTLRFREATGHSILDEILHVRLEKVLALLSQTDTAIGAIPGLCGFRCTSTLDILFHARFHMSMREWRKRYAR